MTDFHYQSAKAITGQFQNGEVSAVEILNGFLKRIDRVNPKVNAIITLDIELAQKQAKELDDARTRGEKLGPLAGLPIAIKDLVETKGIRTTWGSPLFADHVPNFDQLMVTRLKEACAIIIGKTNTPEFGAGSHTFNEVFGATRNPYDLSKSSGGSSGGAAAALASGMLPIADGSDLGGSLRNPASFCNVVGFRPTPGRVPIAPSASTYNPLSVFGPMARNVEDTALLLSAIAGPDVTDPLSLQDPGELFRQPLKSDNRGFKIAWTPDLGHLPVEPDVVEVLQKTLPIFEQLGHHIEEASPSLRRAEETFLHLRAAMYTSRFGALIRSNPESVKETIRWNTEVGLSLSAKDVAKAEEVRTQIYFRMLRFFENYDFLILPAAQVAPFPVELDWVHEINGVKMENYLQWMQICCAITLTSCPAISVPAGFTPEGLPIGLQIVAPPRQDFKLLQFAHAFEQATEFGKKHPKLM